MLEAYCWPLSVASGDAAQLRISTDAGSVDVRVTRDGSESEVAYAETVRAARHDVPTDASEHGCGWPVTLDIATDGWRSGYYAVAVRAGDEQADACFVVRPHPENPAPCLLVLATTTWNAYNDWGGPSLYTGGMRVSFERPFAKGFLVKPEPVGRMMQTEPDQEAMGYRNWARPLGLSDWSGGAGWWNWERPFLHWAESNGYRVDVATSHDLETHPEVLRDHRLSLHVGHDEYWSWGMRDALDAHVAAGGNAAIFSGNSCFWQIRFEDDGRAMTCFKYRAGAEDPVVGTPDERFLSGIWSDRRVGRPETSTIGLTFTHGSPASLEILATAPARLWSQEEQPTRYAQEPGELEHVAAALFGDAGPSNVERVADNHAVMAAFAHPGGGTVVNTGVIDWTFGLKHGDPVVDRITRNVLDRLGGS